MNALRSGCAIVALVAACSRPPASVTEDANACDPPQDAASGRTLHFVIGALTIDELDSPDVPHTGFNLDSHASGPTDPSGCNHQDFFSTIDPDQRAPGMPCTAARVMSGQFCGAVDNQLPTLAGFLLSTLPDSNIGATIRDRIASGELLLVLRVDGVDDAVSDPHVDLSVVAVFDADADCGDNFGGAGRFVVDGRSYEGGDPMQPLWHACSAIVGGRLRTLVPFVSPVQIPVPGHPFEFAGRDSQMRFDLAPDASRITNGNWGAWVEGASMQAAGEVIYCIGRPPEECVPAVRQVVAGLTDIRTAGICVEGTGPSTRYGGISVGYGFEGVAATVVGTGTAPTAGACGAPSPDGGAMDAGGADAADDSAR